MCDLSKGCDCPSKSGSSSIPGLGNSTVTSHREPPASAGQPPPYHSLTQFYSFSEHFSAVGRLLFFFFFFLFSSLKKAVRL